MLVLKGHKTGHAVYAVAFSPDGASLASCSRDRTVRLWDLCQGKHKIISNTDRYDYLSYSVAFSPDGRTLAWPVARGLQLYDVDTADSTTLLTERSTWGEFSKVCFSPNGRTVVAIRGRAFIWECSSRKLLEVWGRGWSSNLAFAPDGRSLAVGREHWNPRNGGYSYEVVLYDPETRIEHATLSTKGTVTGLAFAPNGQRLAAACGKYLTVWDVSTKHQVFQFKCAIRHIKAIAFSPDGCLLAAAHNDRTVRLWRTSDWREHVAFDWGIGEVLCIAFAPDGMTAAAGGRSGRIVLWDIDL